MLVDRLIPSPYFASSTRQMVRKIAHTKFTLLFQADEKFSAVKIHRFIDSCRIFVWTILTIGANGSSPALDEKIVSVDVSVILFPSFSFFSKHKFDFYFRLSVWGRTHSSPWDLRFRKTISVAFEKKTLQQKVGGSVTDPNFFLYAKLVGKRGVETSAGWTILRLKNAASLSVATAQMPNATNKMWRTVTLQEKNCFVATLPTSFFLTSFICLSYIVSSSPSPLSLSLSRSLALLLAYTHRCMFYFPIASRADLKRWIYFIASSCRARLI